MRRSAPGWAYIRWRWVKAAGRFAVVMPASDGAVSEETPDAAAAPWRVAAPAAPRRRGARGRGEAGDKRGRGAAIAGDVTAGAAAAAASAAAASAAAAVAAAAAAAMRWAAPTSRADSAAAVRAERVARERGGDRLRSARREAAARASCSLGGKRLSVRCPVESTISGTDTWLSSNQSESASKSSTAWAARNDGRLRSRGSGPGMTCVPRRRTVPPSSTGMNQWLSARVVRSSPKRKSTEAGRRTAWRRIRCGRAPRYARSQSAPTNVAVAPGSMMATPTGTAPAASTCSPTTEVHTRTWWLAGGPAGGTPTAEARRAEPGATESATGGEAESPDARRRRPQPDAPDSGSGRGLASDSANTPQAPTDPPPTPGPGPPTAGPGARRSSG